MRMPIRSVVLLFVLVLAPAAGGAQSARPPRLAELSASLQTLAQKVNPSVVQIFVTAYALPDEDDRAATGDPELERGGTCCRRRSTRSRGVCCLAT